MHGHDVVGGNNPWLLVSSDLRDVDPVNHIVIAPLREDAAAWHLLSLKILSSKLQDQQHLTN
jgi:hypothetical protein